MKVLVACEFSGRVRDAFIREGHDSWSCDIIPSEVGGPHYKCDVRDVLDWGWDLMVAHPPCTHLASLGAAHFAKKGPKVQQEAVDFVLSLWDAPIPMVAVENPVGVLSTRWCKPTHIVQPYWFGDPERKTTCLWLRGLPALRKTKVVAPNLVTYYNGSTYPAWHDHGLNKGPKRQDRGRERSRFFPGMAAAMASQWGACRPERCMFDPAPATDRPYFSQGVLT